MADEQFLIEEQEALKERDVEIEEPDLLNLAIVSCRNLRWQPACADWVFLSLGWPRSRNGLRACAPRSVNTLSS